MNTTNDTELNRLRDELDAIDNRLKEALKDRFVQIRRIAEYKKERCIAIMQPDRMDAVHQKADSFASEHGIDAGLLRRLYDILIAESCRIENTVIGEQDKSDAVSRLASAAIRIDHIAIAVLNLDNAIRTFSEQFGFELIEQRRVKGEFSGMFAATMRAGGVTFVLCQGDSPASNVSQYIEAYGAGVQHVALEVTGLKAVFDDLIERKADILTEIFHAPGLDQAFTKRDKNSGMQIEIVSRTNNSGFDDKNVRDLFTAMERENVF
jgi:chorismate mutase-like protein